MYTNTSESFNNLITKAGRTFRARILLGDAALEGLSTVKTTSGSNNGEALTLGSTISQMIEIIMDTPDVSLAGQEFELQIGLKLGEDNYEYLPMGIFTPEKITNKQKKTSFTAYDRMMKLSGSYTSDLPDTTDTLSVLNEISEKTDIPIDVTGLTTIGMKKPEGYTYRDALAVVAQLYSCFANVNRAGTIEIHFWEDTGYELTADSGINGFSHGDAVFTVEKIVCITSCDDVGNSNSLSSGDGTKGITISNEFMTQEVLDSIYEKVSGFSYTPVNCPVILGDPRLDPWDLINVTDAEGNSYKTPIMSLFLEYDGGLSNTIVSTVAEESEESNDYKGPMQQLQEKVSGLKVRLASFTREVEERFEDYVTTVQMNSAIEASASEINLNVAAVRTTVDGLESRVESTEASLELKVDTDTLISEINASAGVIILSGNRFVVDSDNLKIAEDGTIIAVNGVFSGELQGATGSFAGDVVANSFVSENEFFKVEVSDGVAITSYTEDAEAGFMSKGLYGATWIFPNAIDMTYNGVSSLMTFYGEYWKFENDVVTQNLRTEGSLVTDTYAAIGTRLYLNNNCGIRGMKNGYDAQEPNTTDSNCIAFVNANDRVILGHAENSEVTEVRSPGAIFLKCNGTTADDDNRYALQFARVNWGTTDSPTYYGCLRSRLDNYTNMGSGSYRYRNVYSTNGVTTTSDRNQKRDIYELDDRYIQLFDLLTPVSYKRINGDRVHVGYVSQDVETALTQIGLTAEDFGGFGKDLVADDEGNPILDDNGRVQYRYSLRYEEFIALNAGKIKQLESDIQRYIGEDTLWKEMIESRVEQLHNFVTECYEIFVEQQTIIETLAQ